MLFEGIFPNVGNLTNSYIYWNINIIHYIYYLDNFNPLIIIMINYKT